MLNRRRPVSFYLTQAQFAELDRAAGGAGISVLIRQALRDAKAISSPDDLQLRPRGQGKNFDRNQQLKCEAQRVSSARRGPEAWASTGSGSLSRYP
jgi:hypothetical protein